ncbi:MAG: acyl carrier protein [Eubacterium sp.]|nr:acyl carrier protein [Eubacterium sp.]
MEFDLLKKVIAQVLSVDAEEITLDTTFEGDLGADSLDVTSIMIELEEQLGIEIGDDDVDTEKIKTVGDAVELIKNAKSAGE